MEIKLYINIVFKRWWIIVLLTILGMVGAGYYSYYSYKPTYMSKTTLLVLSYKYDEVVPIQYSEIMAGQQLVKEFKEIAKSRTILKEVIGDLHITDLSIDKLFQNITVSLKDETRILTITVTDKEPARSKLIADKISEVFIKKTSKLTKDATIEVVDEAEMPTSPLKPNHPKKILIGAIAGLIASIAIIFFIEEMDDSIKSAEDVEKYLGLKVIATIPTLNIK